MADENKVELTRRSFAVTAAQVAVTAPAVAALLSASTKPASAASVYAAALGDDGTFSDNPAFGNPDTYPAGPADDLHTADDFGNPNPPGP